MVHFQQNGKLLGQGQIMVLPTGQIVIGEQSLSCGYTWFLDWDSYLSFVGNWVNFPY